MAEQLDIRWKQRLANFRSVLAQLDDAAALARSRPLSRLEKQGLIHGFEMSFELAWNLIRDFFVWQGETGIIGSRDAIRHAFKHGLIVDGERWMEMLKTRNLLRIRTTSSSPTRSRSMCCRASCLCSSSSIDACRSGLPRRPVDDRREG